MRQLESFFWGIIAALGALVVQTILATGISLYRGDDLSTAKLLVLPSFIIAAAAIEEIFKYFIISRRVDIFSLGGFYLLNSIFVGLGFFAVEAALASQNLPAPSYGMLTQISLLHMGTAGLIGYMVATRSPKKFSTAFSAILFASFFHIAYNLLARSGNYVINYVIVFLLALLLFINAVNFFRLKTKLAHG